MKPTAARCQPWFLYVVECADNTLYTGISTNVARRLEEHNSGRGARYTASRRPVTLCGTWRYPDRPSAMRAEIAFKRKARSEKRRLLRTAAEFGEGRRMQLRKE